jgi:hypothetical protein
MLLRSHRYLVITTLSLFVLIGTVVVWYVFLTSTKNAGNLVASAPVVTPLLLAQKYHDNLGNIINQLEPLLNRELTVSDSAGLIKLKDELLKLMVPQKSQEFHLNLVLKISKLVELLKPGRVAIAAKGSPTITSTQTSLKNLLKQAP